MTLLKKISIPAEAITDDLKFRVIFDASGWFEQASPQAILKLASVNWAYKQHKGCDDIARYCAKNNQKLTEMHAHLVSRKDESGFSCRVDAGCALQWIKENKHGLWDHINHQEFVGKQQDDQSIQYTPLQ